MENNCKTAKKTIALVANTLWYVINFRVSLILRIKKIGYNVVVLSKYDRECVKLLEEMDVKFENVGFNSTSLSPLKEILVAKQIVNAIKKHSVSVVISYTPKANIDSGLAALWCRVKYIPNISGFGVVVNKGWWLKKLIFTFYRIALWQSHLVFLQNPDDLKLLVGSGLVPATRCKLLPGSGVNLDHFYPTILNVRVPGETVFLFASRLLWEKGIGLFVEAARTLRHRFPNVVFRVAGFIDNSSPYSVSSNEVYRWVEEGIIEYLGVRRDVRMDLADCDCVVLPSFYGEGVPRILLEAAAMMRPVITADSVGCREAVVDGVTGFLCKARDVDDLARVLEQFINTPHGVRLKMAEKGRQRIERNFNEVIVLDAYETILTKLIL